jgi:hypothetical protein
MQRIGLEESRIISAVLGFISLVVVTVVLNFYGSPRIKKKAKLLQKNFKIVGSFNIFGSVFVFSYLMGTSYDYRLVITFPIFMALYSVCENVKEKIILLILMLLIMYGGNLPYNLNTGVLPLNAISDLVIMAFSSIILLLLLKSNLRENVSYK